MFTAKDYYACALPGRRPSVFTVAGEGGRAVSCVLGEKLKLKVDCRFNINKDNAIEAWGKTPRTLRTGRCSASFTSPSSTSMGILLVAHIRML